MASTPHPRSAGTPVGSGGGSHVGSGVAPRGSHGVSATDEVDRIVAAWEREVPELSVTPLHVLSRISRLARHLDLARKEAFAAHHLDVWEFDVMSALRRSGPPYELSPGALVQQTLSTSGTMTNRIDRLERRGFVQRHRDADDRRGVKVRLTPAGADIVDAAMGDLLTREHQLLAELGTQEQAHLTDLLRGLLASFEQGGSQPRRG